GSFSGHWRIDFYLYIPSATPNQVSFMRATGDGTVRTWLIDTSAGNVGVTGLDSSGTSITSSVALGVDFFDRWVNVQLVAVQNGADIDWDLTWFPVQYPAHAGWTFGDPGERDRGRHYRRGVASRR